MTRRFPYWIILGAIGLAIGYAPTLATPFDFIDDGNLVYPAPEGTTLGGHVAIWWEKVQANYEHLGPFRPTLWMHWELFANVAGGDAAIWRGIRFLWCGLAAGMLLWLMRELKVHPLAALAAAAVAMWCPSRNEIWTSLTLAEGVAMPYALLSLVAARKAAHANRPWAWDLLAVVGCIVALGCKNTFIALIPAQVALRMFPEGMTLLEGWRKNRWRALALTLTAALPLAHFVYFKLHWHPGQYETHGPSLAQVGRILNSLKAAMALDFLGAGVVLSLIVVRLKSWSCGRGELAAGLLLVCGFVVYLPMDMMSGRYTMPAVWGLDILFALLLTRLLMLPSSWPKTLACIAIVVGVVLVGGANLIRQEKFAARARMLWSVVAHLEANAPPNAVVAWQSGNSHAGELNVEEGIHVKWHLQHRGRGDVRISLVDREGQPIVRTELDSTTAPPTFRIAGGPGEVTFREAYQFGRKLFECHIER